MTLTDEQIAQGWKLHDGSDVCPIKDDETVHQVMSPHAPASRTAHTLAREWTWRNIYAYRIIEAHGADAEPARLTPWPQSYDDLVFDDQNWSQTIIVDGKRPEWLRDDDRCTHYHGGSGTAVGMIFMAVDNALAIRIRRREPKRETVRCCLTVFLPYPSMPLKDVRATIDLVDGKPDLSTLKLEEQQ